MEFKIPTPIQEIFPSVFTERGVRFFIKRDDLVHPHVSGNKWRKLKFNLQEAKNKGATTMLTFGGAYSNHLAAVAAAGEMFDFHTIGMVRGEKIAPLNPTLSFCEKKGMKLHYVSRKDFREKSNEALVKNLNIATSATYLVPDGGSNALALLGVTEMVDEIGNQLDEIPDYICSACGTGATLAGIVCGLDGKGRALGVSVLKGDFMEKEVAEFLKFGCSKKLDRYEIRHEYHFGGYAKFSSDLIQFINQFKTKFNIPLDPIYTGKLAFALFDLAEKEYFKEGQQIVMVHTGGLQGIAGFNERFGGLLT